MMSLSGLSLIIIFLSSMNLFAESVVTSSDDRRKADREARHAFLNLNFYAEGRGIHTSPGLIRYYRAVQGTKLVEHTMRTRWGMNVVDHKVIGLFDVEDRGMSLAVLGCVACHSGKAAGQFIVGLGNKNVDPLQIGKDLLRIQSVYDKVTFSKGIKGETERAAIEFAKVLASEKWGNLTQGLVPISIIRTWFYKQAGVPVPHDMAKGQVKVPFLWGYGVKRRVGQFSDGYGDGTLPGWAIAVELTAGQTPEAVRRYLPKVEKAEDMLGDLLPPPYPFTIDAIRAERGAAVFANTCQRCHGTYSRDSSNLPIYQEPKWIPIEVVRTDQDRLESNGEQFNDLVARNPLNDIIKFFPNRKGYFAPRLEGVWARFPYLHNGSVPNIESLLTPPEIRPLVFSVKNAGEWERFDENRLGLTLPTSTSEMQKLIRKAQSGNRTIYDTHRVGHSAQGHAFGVHLTGTQKRDLIEFLKTL